MQADFLQNIKILQPSSGYRFSVDALLLYSFVNMHTASMIADFGAGSGVIGLLLASRYQKAFVYLIELQDELASYAQQNIILNKLSSRTKLIKADICAVYNQHKELPCEGFDLIVSNPPFRKLNTGLISNVSSKAIARHEKYMPIDKMLKASAYLLKQKGRLCIIHLPERICEVFHYMRLCNLEPKRLRLVHSFVKEGAKMVLIEAIKGSKPGLKVLAPLVIYNPDGSYTEEMQSMYSRV